MLPPTLLTKIRIILYHRSIQVIPRIREDKKQHLFPSFLEKELF
jgi:hypothetical protein